MYETGIVGMRVGFVGGVGGIVGGWSSRSLRKNDNRNGLYRVRRQSRPVCCKKESTGSSGGNGKRKKKEMDGKKQGKNGLFADFRPFEFLYESFFEVLPSIEFPPFVRTIRMVFFTFYLILFVICFVYVTDLTLEYLCAKILKRTFT